MSTCGPYVPVLKADFGRTITEAEINNEFEEIERIMECICTAMQTTTSNVSNFVNLGSVTNTTIISAADGLIQYLTVEGDIDLNVADPEEGEPRLITLVIADGGAGRFNFPAGATWTSDVAGDSMDGYPWDSQGLGGDYGALVTCVYDGEGWIFTVFGRHDIDYTVPAEVEDVYNWR
jgi:hypothetical protein